MKKQTVETIRLVGGHPALDFVNTVDAGRDREGTDVLTTYADAICWAARASVVDAALQSHLAYLADGDPVIARTALVRLVEVREALYEVFLAEADVSLPSVKTVSAVKRFVNEALLHRALVGQDGEFAWGWANEDLNAILYHTVFAAAELLVRSAERRRISQCQGRNCGWLFLDSSRPGRRRWCSDESCGTSERVRRFRNKAME